MSEKVFQAETRFNLKMRIDMARVLMGKSYPMALLVAGGVLLYNYYLIYSGRGVQGDVEKTVSLFILMVAWALVPVVAGFLWHRLSKVKTQRVTIYANEALVETNLGSFKLLPQRFYVVFEREGYVVFGSEYLPLACRQRCVMFNKKELTLGDEDKIVNYLYEMKYQSREQKE